MTHAANPESMEHEAPGGGKVLGSLFQVADRLTVKVAMLSSDMSPHPTKQTKQKEKKQPFFAAWWCLLS